MAGTSRCYSCGLTAEMPDDSKLILDHAPQDENGLNKIFLYCRRCHKATLFEPAGCLAMLFTFTIHSPLRVYDPVEIWQKAPETFGIFSPRIQNAMRQDGVIP